MITPTAELNALWCLPTASARHCRHVPEVCTLRISQLFSGPPYHTQKNLSCRELQTSTEIMPLFFFFPPLSEIKKTTYKIRRCFRTGVNAKDKTSDWLIIWRGAADITHDHQKVSFLSFLCVSLKPRRHSKQQRWGFLQALPLSAFPDTSWSASALLCSLPSPCSS